MSVLDELAKAVYEGNDKQAQACTRDALRDGYAPSIIVVDGLMAGMRDVERRVDDGTMYLPELLLCSRALTNSVAILRPYIDDDSPDRPKRVVVGSLLGARNNMTTVVVKSCLNRGGFEVNDLGSSVTVSAFIDYLTHTPDCAAAFFASQPISEQSYTKEFATFTEETGLLEDVKLYICMDNGTPPSENIPGIDHFLCDLRASASVAVSLISGHIRA